MTNNTDIKHGEWDIGEFQDGWFFHRCSSCNKISCMFTFQEFDYCPRCGSKMKKIFSRKKDDEHELA